MKACIYIYRWDIIGTTDIYSTKKISFETECPICFLFYPSNINKTRCCHKSICTECFLQFKRSSSSPLIPAVCPFCVQPNLGVVYLPPPWSKHYDKLKRSRPDLYTTKKIEPDDPNVIYVDTIRPKWEEMLDDASSSAVGSTRRRRVPLTNEIRRRRRRTDYDETIYDTSAELDLEDVLVMEAIRLSLTHTTN
ncbi:unnamed protein product [Rhizopus microsporus]